MSVEFDAKVLADSVNPHGDRLTSLEVCFPRLILSEFNTHGMFSRNSASSRAVPVGKKVQEALEAPFVPERFGVNQRGMSASNDLSGIEHDEARRIWLSARDQAVIHTLRMLYGEDLKLDGDDLRAAALELLGGNSAPRLDVHKQIANRLLEPFLWHTVVVTATEWSNFFALRLSPAAQPEIRRAAELMRDAMAASAPTSVGAGAWHLPLLLDDELQQYADDPDYWAKISAARCARVSYLTHHGVRDTSADLSLAERLLSEGHMSPFEHVARAMTAEERRARERVGKLRGWVPLRSTLPNESDFSKIEAGRPKYSQPTV